MSMVNGAESERVQFRAGNVEEEAAQLGRGKTCTADNRRKEHALIVQRASHCALAQLLPADCTENLRIIFVCLRILLRSASRAMISFSHRANPTPCRPNPLSAPLPPLPPRPQGRPRTLHARLPLQFDLSRPLVPVRRSLQCQPRL